MELSVLIGQFPIKHNNKISKLVLHENMKIYIYSFNDSVSNIT